MKTKNNKPVCAYCNQTKCGCGAKAYKSVPLIEVISVFDISSVTDFLIWRDDNSYTFSFRAGENSFESFVIPTSKLYELADKYGILYGHNVPNLISQHLSELWRERKLIDMHDFLLGVEKGVLPKNLVDGYYGYRYHGSTSAYA